MRIKRISALTMLAAVFLLRASIAMAGSSGSLFTISITVTPTPAQSLRDVEISVHDSAGKMIVWMRQQQADYIRDPATIRTQVLANLQGGLEVDPLCHGHLTVMEEGVRSAEK
jgi:hypothetical protein